MNPVSRSVRFLATHSEEDGWSVVQSMLPRVRVPLSTHRTSATISCPKTIYETCDQARAAGYARSEVIPLSVKQVAASEPILRIPNVLL